MKIFCLFLSIFLVVTQFFVIVSVSFETTIPPANYCTDQPLIDGEFDPYSPCVNCSYLPDEFLICAEPYDHNGNQTSQDEMGHGCVKFGGERYEDVERTRVWCDVVEGIECYGERHFLSIKHHPCVKYTGHYFVTTLIYSVLLGFLGMDRFCLGHTGEAVGKLLTLGGFGIWWIVDVILLAIGELKPADDSSWVPYY